MLPCVRVVRISLLRAVPGVIQCAIGRPDVRAILVAPAQLREPMPMRSQIAPRFCSTQRTARFAGPRRTGAAKHVASRCGTRSGAAQW
jgi:hypothetical protein